MKKAPLLLLTIVSLIICSCSSGDKNTGGGDSYSRTALLTNWADNIIIPAYVDYQTKVGSLSSAVSAFNSDPTEANLQAARQSWLTAYKAFQYVAMFNIGKAEEIYLKETGNIYPTDIASIDSNIASGNYDLTAISQFSKQGFPALDYLLNGLASDDSQIVSFYVSDPNAQGYRNYLTAVVERLQDNVDAVVNDWNSGYRESFIDNNGNSVSSSVNMIVNSYVMYFEKNIRAAKIGIPAGMFSNGVQFPDKVEGYYMNDISKELLSASIQAARDFFNGKHFNGTTNGEGLKSYLDFINAVRDGQNLSDVINNQFTLIQNSIAQLNDSFSQQIYSDNSEMLAAYDTLQQNVIYLKLDMMQALNITVDYVDSDGD